MIQISEKAIKDIAKKSRNTMQFQYHLSKKILDKAGLKLKQHNCVSADHNGALKKTGYKIELLRRKK